jgi:hypothetical protein
MRRSMGFFPALSALERVQQAITPFRWDAARLKNF